MLCLLFHPVLESETQVLAAEPEWPEDEEVCFGRRLSFVLAVTLGNWVPSRLFLIVSECSLLCLLTWGVEPSALIFGG